MPNKMEFQKHHKNDKIWWVVNPDVVGEWLFSFDKKTVYNMFRDYPYNLTEDQIKIFDRENPYWAEFFNERKQEMGAE